MIFNLYKERGETPFECIQRFRLNNAEHRDEKWTYLGRLDPMADGVLLAATGSDTSQERREEFLDLDKEYEFTALFGFSTDTYDTLGKILRVEKINAEEVSETILSRLVKTYEGEREQKYPPFSAKPINGKPMHEWARENALEEVEIPTKTIKVHNIEFIGTQELSAKELLGRLLMDIGKVKGDFRQAETLTLWKVMLKGFIESDVKLHIGKFRASVSSGTYIRSIVNDLGNSLGLGACALSITRTRVGTFQITESVR